MPTDFSMRLDKHNENRCQVAFDAHRYDPAKVQVFVDRYLELMDLCSRAPQSSLEKLMQRDNSPQQNRRAA